MRKLMLVAIGFLFAGSISAHGYGEGRRECHERYFEPNRFERVIIARPAPRYYEQPYGYRYERRRDCERFEHRGYHREGYYR